MPISGTHTVVGALLGAGITICGPDSLDWSRLIKIVASWFISPVMSGILSFVAQLAVLGLTCDTKRHSFKARLHFQQLITATCFLIIGYIMDDLLHDNEKHLALVLSISPLVGVIFFRNILLIRLYQNIGEQNSLFKDVL
jgi:PiT family inorganic phosphate transporter